MSKSCRNPATCFLEECSFQHSADRCPKWKQCQEFSCLFRHAKNRTRPCKMGADCGNGECTFLHPATKVVEKIIAVKSPGTECQTLPYHLSL